MSYLLRLSAYLFVLLSFNSKALVINGCAIEPYTSCPYTDLTYSDLSNTDLSNSIFYGNYFEGSNFSGTVLENVYISDSDLTNVNFSYADLSGAILFQNNMIGADFSYADLTGAEIIYTVIGNANFTGANLSDAFFHDVYGSDYILNGAIYNEGTTLPNGIIPQRLGMIFVSEVPLPAGIYLFLSGLVGLGVLKNKKRKLN